MRASLGIGVVVLVALLGSSETRASSPAKVFDAGQGCTIVGPFPGALEGHVTGTHAVRFDLLGESGKLLGRQIVFNDLGGSHDILLSSEAQLINNNKRPRVMCFAEGSARIAALTVVDVGPQIILHDLYLGRGSVTVSFYAYFENFFAGRKDEGLVNQLFSVRFDGRPPSQVQVMAEPGQAVTVRFDGVKPGEHRLRFGNLHLDGSKGTYATTNLYDLKFVQPDNLEGRKRGAGS